MLKIKYFTFLFFIFSSQLASAQKFTLSGYIEDVETGEKLIAANVFEKELLVGTVTNNFGFYSITLPKGATHLSFSYIGYQPKEIDIDLTSNQKLDIKLSSSLLLEEVEVVASQVTRIEEETQMSKVDIPIEQIKKIPQLLGETDVLKTLQLLPGVQSGGEGQTGLYVRGGSPDQNLVLLDGVPIYNVSHLLGIFSVFNADALKTVTLTKGGFPARFGGRLSSVLEITTKDGHKSEYHGTGSIGLISSKFAFEGPIIKEKTTFMVSARRTYWDILAKPFVKAAANNFEGTDVGGALYFYDINAKVTHKINDRNKLFLSVYNGADIFKVKVKENYPDNSYENEGGITWGNFLTSLRWNNQISPKLFANTTLTYSNYDLNIFSSIAEEYTDPFTNEIVSDKYGAKYVSGIKDFAGKVDFDYLPTPNHSLKFGGAAIHHAYSPGALNLKFENADEEFNLDTLIGETVENTMEYDFYVEDDMAYGNLKANLGLHFSMFNTEGKIYTSLQPRIGLRYLLPRNLAIKASFSTMAQYLNLLTSESISLPSDLWVPSTKSIKPQESYQVALGIAQTYNNTFEISVEGFYKEMKNMVSYLPGESFLSGFETLEQGNSWENKITQGDGTAYGAEFFIQKKKGKTTGWIGYTLSWNWRKFNKINGGKKYPYKYDRRHDLSIVLIHDFNDKISATATWVFGTGNAVTLPLYKYPEPNASFNSKAVGDKIKYYLGDYDEIENSKEKNTFRMSNYHRLDLGVNFTKQKKWGDRTWSVGVYNAYAHSNPYFIYRSSFFNVGNKPSFKEVSILPFLPSVSYSFKF